MSDTLEAVALAVRDCYNGIPPRDIQSFSRKVARAVTAILLERMREPSEAMLQAPQARGQVGPMGADEVWQAVLDQFEKETLGHD